MDRRAVSPAAKQGYLLPDRYKAVPRNKQQLRGKQEMGRTTPTPAVQSIVCIVVAVDETMGHGRAERCGYDAVVWREAEIFAPPPHISTRAMTIGGQAGQNARRYGLETKGHGAKGYHHRCCLPLLLQRVQQGQKVSDHCRRHAIFLEKQERGTATPPAN